jgi:Uma2 family endonuclease
MTATENLMVEIWERLCTTPGFSHPGFTCDVSPDGKVIMSPTFNYHGWYQARLSVLFAQIAPTGQPFVELAVLTNAGLFEVDVAWTREFRKLRAQKYASPAPEICVEVESESNTAEEFDRKKEALFSAGCSEVWIVRKDGQIEFYATGRLMDRSALLPAFPTNIAD